jgi:hypothetical protein
LNVGRLPAMMALEMCSWRLRRGGEEAVIEFLRLSAGWIGIWLVYMAVVKGSVIVRSIKCDVQSYVSVSVPLLKKWSPVHQWLSLGIWGETWSSGIEINARIHWFIWSSEIDSQSQDPFEFVTHLRFWDHSFIRSVNHPDVIAIQSVPVLCYDSLSVWTGITVTWDTHTNH